MDHHFARAYALACGDVGVGRDGRLALLRWATRRDITTSLDVQPTEIVECWRALIAYVDGRLAFRERAHVIDVVDATP